MNYQLLLRKYIALVGECEGTTFMSSVQEPDFNKEECEELNRLDKLDESLTKLQNEK